VEKYQRAIVEATFVKVSHRTGDQNLLSRAPPCFGRQASFMMVDVRQADGRKKIAESLSQHDEKHVVPTPLTPEIKNES
jgi:hypothetical protein